MPITSLGPPPAPFTLGGRTFDLSDKLMSNLINNPNGRDVIAPLIATNPTVSETSGRFSSREYGSLYGWFRAGGSVAAGQNSFIASELAQFQPPIVGSDSGPVKRTISPELLDPIVAWRPRLDDLRQKVEMLYARAEISAAERGPAIRGLDALTWVSSQAADAAKRMRAAGVKTIYADVMTQRVVR